VKFVLFDRGGSPPSYGVLTEAGIVSLEGVLEGETPQEMLEQLIDGFDTLRSRLDGLGTAASIALSEARLLAPVPWPGKIVTTTAVYAPGAADRRPQLLATLKSAESVTGPGGTVRLPDVDASWQFVPNASLGLVMRGPSKNVAAEAWRSAVFGYTCTIDVMPHPVTRSGADQTVDHPPPPSGQPFGRDLWFAKADTLGPIGPCIVTIDELPEPRGARVRSWQNGVPAQDFLIGDASYSIPEQVEFVTTVMTLRSGDVVTCGTSPEGQRPLADGDRVEVEIDGVGRLAVDVVALVRSAA
jgi:2-keto-4-pentenoate hydratase/2-oxohepta-3-ene-1,7-dioic acid hydratase in catechol pathway